MRARYLLAGISAMAFAATAATAQNTNNINSSGGTGNTATCTNNTLGSTGNTCTIIQVGSNNTATADQPGNNNTSTITQVGNNNIADHDQFGTNSVAESDQNGSFNNSRIIQRGDGNAAKAEQDGESQTSEIRQNGSGLVANVTQNGTVGGSAETNTSLIRQARLGNRATLTQTGRFNSSEINQASRLDGNANEVGGETQDSWFNTATVVQNGNRTRSLVEQGIDGPSWGDNNVADVTLLNNGSGVQAADTFTNLSEIRQNTSANRATVYIAGGEAQRNSSTLLQRGGPSNEAFVSLSQGSQQFSDIDQNGANNYAEVTMTDGVAGINSAAPAGSPELNLSGGNTATIDQVGNGSTAVVTTGTNQEFRGLGNNVTINQNATAGYSDQGAPSANQTTTATADRLGYTEFGRTGATGNFTGANGQYVETWQQGRFDTASISQTDNANGSGVTYAADGSVGRARAGVYQSSSVGTVQVVQEGDNYGEVTQANGQSSFVTLQQVDAGDIDNGNTVTPQPCVDDGFGNCVPQPDIITPNPPGRQYNQAILTQNGNSNRQQVIQNTRDGYVETFQRTQSSGSILAATQGTGNSGILAGASLGATYAGNPISAAPPTGAGTQRLTAVIEQGNPGGTSANNVAVSFQDGTDLYSEVNQAGTGSAYIGNFGFGTNGGNRVLIAQQGERNRAVANQTSNVGDSTAAGPASGNNAAQNAALGDPAVDDEFYFAGGARSPEIDILQAGTDNSASVTQRGKGQYARIEQGPGSNNRAGIVQDAGATNATAVIRQDGSNNTFYVVQTAPGQYIAVEQTGNNNSATNIIQRGPAGGSSGFVPQPGS